MSSYKGRLKVHGERRNISLMLIRKMPGRSCPELRSDPNVFTMHFPHDERTAHIFGVRLKRNKTETRNWKCAVSLTPGATPAGDLGRSSPRARPVECSALRCLFVPFFRVIINREVRTGDSALREKTWIEIKRFKLF